MKNVAESIRARLLNIAKQSNTEFTNILVRYAIERFLYRLSISEHTGRFLLKGATLLVLWGGEPYRPTRDVDLLALGDSSVESLKETFTEVLKIKCDDDGLSFLPHTLDIATIKEGQQYEGLRVTFQWSWLVR